MICMKKDTVYHFELESRDVLHNFSVPAIAAGRFLAVQSRAGLSPTRRACMTFNVQKSVDMVTELWVQQS